MTPHVLLISASALHRDPRVRIQIAALADDHHLVCIGLTPPRDARVEFLSMALLGWSLGQKIVRRGLRRVWSWLVRHRWYRVAYLAQSHVVATHLRTRGLRPDVILCNDIDMLPVAAFIKRKTGARLYLDAHEYTPRQFEGTPGCEKERPYWDFLLRCYGPSIDHMTTVCQSIADEYRSVFARPTHDLVFNFPAREDLHPSTVDAAHLRLVHHGIASKPRKLETLIEIVEGLDARFTLDFFLVPGSPRYIEELKERARDEPRIRFREAVATEELARVINQYDIGVFTLPPGSVNQRFALPNKFFEFIQARLAIAIWPSVEMKPVVEKHGLGFVTENFDTKEMSDLLLALTAEDVVRAKKNAHLAAGQFHAGQSRVTIRRGIRRCLDLAVKNE